MKKKEVKDEKYQQLLKDISAIIEEGRKKTDSLLKGMPPGIKDAILKNNDDPFINKDKKNISHEPPHHPTMP